MAPASEAPVSEAPASEAPAAGGAVTVMVAELDFGPILVDAEGKTLYMFKPDTAGEPTCYEECETNWPPLVVTGDDHGRRGPRRSDLHDGGPHRRVDAGQGRSVAALLLQANDAAAGDVNGQGQGDVWYVVSPAGEPIEE